MYSFILVYPMCSVVKDVLPFRGSNADLFGESINPLLKHRTVLISLEWKWKEMAEVKITKSAEKRTELYTANRQTYADFSLRNIRERFKYYTGL